jgi:hypothetical protein
MIILEYLVNENALIEDLSVDPFAENFAVLQETYFIFPTRLNINANEMFSRSKNERVMCSKEPEGDLEMINQTIETNWLPVPLLHLATIGFAQIQKAYNVETTVYSLPGTGTYLHLIPQQRELDVRSTISEKIERVKCQDILKTFIDFRHQVFCLLINESKKLETKKNGRI